MAKTRGCLGKIKVGSTPSLVAETKSYSITETCDPQDTSTLGSCAKTHGPGPTGWNANITAFWDKTDTNGQEALSAGAELTVELYPEGDASGANYCTGTAIVTEVGISGDHGTYVERTFNVVGDGALTWDTVA